MKLFNGSHYTGRLDHPDAELTSDPAVGAGMSLNARAVALVRERFGTRTPSNEEIAELLVEFASAVRGETMIRMAEWRDKASFAQEQLSRTREIERLRGGGWG